MGVCDVVASNFTMIYVAVTAGVKAYGVVYGRSYSGGYVVIVSFMVMALILVATLTWDLSCKFKHVYDRDHHDDHPRKPCKGGIYWHGVAELSPAPPFRFRVPHLVPHDTV